MSDMAPPAGRVSGSVTDWTRRWVESVELIRIIWSQNHCYISNVCPSFCRWANASTWTESKQRFHLEETAYSSHPDWIQLHHLLFALFTLHNQNLPQCIQWARSILQLRPLPGTMKQVCLMMGSDCSVRRLEIRSSTAPFTLLPSSIFLLLLLCLPGQIACSAGWPGGLTPRASDSSLSGPGLAQDAGP